MGNGVVNGASFNYSNENNDEHWQLDMNSVDPWDPNYRDKVTKGYISPNNLKSSLQDFWEDIPQYFGRDNNKKSWENSYWNADGYYSNNGVSVHDRIEEARDELRNMIKNQGLK